ncbi:hypothetical protein ACFQJC_13945 [Haloferax namakaokahaiae]|uniref:Lipoprotein n=1 Tax=Haloferax namakaokahaiae TaxID=1748331 RepID=A0ABD5ZH88_9EURY
MKRQLLVVLCLLSLAGCSGLSGQPPATPTESEEPWEYRIVVENGYEAQAFTVSLTTKSGQTVVNETRSVDSGERWVATTLTETAHSDQAYVLTISAEDEGQLVSKEFDATPQADVTYTSGATLYVFGPGESSVHNCGGNVTCYEKISKQ